MVSILAGLGFSYLIGLKKAAVHDAMPILMLGIGVDDIFVICNAFDQTSLKLPASERIKKGMRHAGPSITITSLTNALAFISGSGSSIAGISSFCKFCCITIMMLYTSVMLIFLPVIYWDTVRVEKQGKECFGFCFCKESSALFCHGKLLSEP